MTTQSMRCRLCAKEDEDNCSSIFEKPGLLEDLVYFLPLEIKPDSPFPKHMCSKCTDDFVDLKSFFIRINEGQSVLSDMISLEKNVVIPMPNILAEKRNIYRERYPCMPKNVVKKVGKKLKATHVIVDPVRTKRERKLPTRLAESVQGSDLEKIFVKEESASTKSAAIENLAESKCKDVENKAQPAKPIGRRRNKCDICSKVFKIYGRLVHHRNTAHKGVFYACLAAECGRRYKTRVALNSHHKTVGHEGFELVELNQESTLDVDNPGGSKSTNDEGTACDVCHQKFADLELLQNHSCNIQGADLTCQEGRKIFNQPPSLSGIDESQNKGHETVFSCQTCQKTFKTCSHLNRHQFVHSMVKPFSCDTCGQKFKTKTHYESHKSVHGGERMYSCEVCGKQFRYRASLLTHIKLHGDDRCPHKCPHCPKAFAQAGNLREHIRIHTGEKPFACTLCSRRFTTSSQHKLHEKRHRGEKPWKCDFCPKAFLHKDSYNSHIRRHQGDKPFSCEFCKKSFTDTWALKKHQRLHTGDKPYVCKACGKGFSDSSNLTKHKRTHVKQNTKDDAVWNIIRQATESAASQDDEDNGQETTVIYITYENDDAGVHIVSQKEDAIEPSDGQAGSIDMVPESLAVTDQAENSQTIQLISHNEGDLGNLNSESGKNEDLNAQYVDLKIRDSQHVRLKLPENADPIAYATEYLQAMADNGEIIDKEGLLPVDD